MGNLVLARKKQESVVLSKDGEILCEVVVTALGSSQVKLAFEARSDIKIDRKEVYGRNK
jgi:carbon storage regulator CsrA